MEQNAFKRRTGEQLEVARLLIAVADQAQVTRPQPGQFWVGLLLGLRQARCVICTAQGLYRLTARGHVLLVALLQAQEAQHGDAGRK